MSAKALCDHRRGEPCPRARGMIWDGCHHMSLNCIAEHEFELADEGGVQGEKYPSEEHGFVHLLLMHSISSGWLSPYSVP